MSNYERLTYEDKGGIGVRGQNPMTLQCYSVILQRLYELENKIENKELVKGVKTHNIKLLPCKCGAKRREFWVADFCVFYRCSQCGYESKHYKNVTALKQGWNEEMRRMD